jgi:probable HAF family extracellular repeat protein
LGDLPGGGFYSNGAVSTDGSVVVGQGSSDSGYEAFRWTLAGGMAGLGDLPGGAFGSLATGVSADGSVVVGIGTSASGTEAFRWTAAGGMVGLGDLPGGIFRSQAAGVSADGSVVVGASLSASGAEAIRWTAAGGMRSLRDILVNDYGLETQLTGWTLTAATSCSANGRVIVGYGTNPAGQNEAWIARLDAPQIINVLTHGWNPKGNLDDATFDPSDPS